MANIKSAKKRIKVNETKRANNVPVKSVMKTTIKKALVNPSEETLKEALEMVKTGSVTYAVRDTEMDGIEIKEGNMLGLVESKIKAVGEDYFEVAKEILESMIDEDSELITIFYGKDVDESKMEEFIAELEDKYDAKVNIGVVSNIVKQELTKNAVLSVLLAMIGIIIYLLFTVRVTGIYLFASHKLKVDLQYII